MQRDPRATSQAYLLLDYVQRLNRHRKGRRAVHIHLSRLKPQNRREQHIRVAANTFADLVRQFEGQIFPLASGDIVFVCRDAALDDIDDAVMRLRYLFSEDSLVQGDDEESIARFCTWYNLEAQYSRFLAAAEQLYGDEQRREKRLAAAAQEDGEAGAQPDDRRPLSPEQLGRLEEFLARTDLSSVLRRQAICAVAGSGAPQPILREIFVSIDDLATSVLPEVNLASNRWLFQHLTETLDRRVLKLLSRGEDSALHASVSINLNLATVLSPAFLDFDASLRAGSRGTIVIEVQAVDVFGDWRAFLFARDFAHEKGYRICLDGVDAGFLPLIDRRRLGVDFVKVNWAPDLADDSADGPRDELRRCVEGIGKARVILARCEQPAAVRTGQAAGVSLFQGHHIDSILQGGRPYVSPPRRAPRRLLGQ